MEEHSTPNLTETHSTPNLYEAAALDTERIKLLGLEDGYAGKQEFVFKRDDNCDRIVNQFLSGTLVQNIQNFIDSWRRLRRLLDTKEIGHGNGKHYRR